MPDNRTSQPDTYHDLPSYMEVSQWQQIQTRSNILLLLPGARLAGLVLPLHSVLSQWFEDSGTFSACWVILQFP